MPSDRATPRRPRPVVTTQITDVRVPDHVRVDAAKARAAGVQWRTSAEYPHRVLYGPLEHTREATAVYDRQLRQRRAREEQQREVARQEDRVRGRRIMTGSR